MSDVPKVKVTYQKQSFTVDKIEMISLDELKAAEGVCFAEFLRRQEQQILQAMGLPADLFAAERAKRERQLRAIMGDEFLEDNAVAPGALLYWRLIAAQPE